jgi:putative membrane protein
MCSRTLLIASLSAWSLGAALSVYAQNVTQLPTDIGDMSGMNVQAPGRRAPSSLDKKFVTSAAQADEEEMAAARLAIDDSGRSDVKNVAAMLQRDHVRAERELASLAHARDMSVPAPGRAGEAPRAGNYTDAGYISSRIMAHQKAIALFQNECRNGSDPALRSFAAKTLPTLRGHLQALQSLPSSP